MYANSKDQSTKIADIILNSIPNNPTLAYSVIREIQVALLPDQQLSIFNAISDSPKLTRDIASSLELPAKHVAAQLQQIMNNYPYLIKIVNSGNRFHLWIRQ